MGRYRFRPYGEQPGDAPPAGRGAAAYALEVLEQRILLSGDLLDPDLDGIVGGGAGVPVIEAIEDRVVNEEELLRFRLEASVPGDPGASVVFSLGDGAADGAALSPDGEFTWTPGEAQGPGEFEFTVIASDADDPTGTDTGTFSVVVNEVNRPPELPVLPNRTIDEGSTLAFSLDSTDPDLPPNALTHRLVSGPEGARLTPEGVFSFTPTEAQGGGVFDVTVAVIDDGDPALEESQTFSIIVNEVIEGPLAVVGFDPTSTGVRVQFNRPLGPAELNLYDSQQTIRGPPDLVLSGENTGTARGSLAIDATAGTVTFVHTDGLLEPDSYTLTLRSGPDGFLDADEGLLDGDGDGATGDDFVATFTVDPPAGAVLGVTSFARGPGQRVDTGSGAGSGAIGLPISIDDATGLETLFFVLRYDPALLEIRDVGAGTGLPEEATVVVGGAAGRLEIELFLPEALGGGPVDLVRLDARVPLDAISGAAHVVDIDGLLLNEGAIAAVDRDGMHVVAFPGDATGNGDYSALDAQRILRVAVLLDRGFDAFPLIDPLLVADVTGNGRLSALDAARVLQISTGLDQPDIPPLPELEPPILTAGLANDTGFDPGDGVTSDPTITGSAVDAGGLLALRGVVGDLDPVFFRDLTGRVGADGAFTLDRAALEELGGDPLEDGVVLVRLQAQDRSGNLSNIVDVTFTLDTTPPAPPVAGLDPASDSNPPGDGRTTRTPVTIVGETEAGAFVELVETGASSVADALGAFSLAGIALAEGPNTLTIRVSDLAGNSSETTLTITRRGEFDAPVISAALARDTGRSAADRITSDPTITGSVADASAIASFRAGLDGTAVADFVSILGQLGPNGDFLLDRALLETINRGPLADGSRTLRLIAADELGNVSNELSIRFTLDTTPPSLQVLSPSEGDVVSGGERVVGSATDALGAPRVTYQFTAARVFRAAADPASGVFSTALNFSGLPEGPLTLTVTARDAAGNSAAHATNLVLRVPFVISAVSPRNGEARVGVTVRPQVTFSEPVDVSTLNGDNLFASFGGRKLAARIVPANDGRFAWLFFDRPMPAASQIEVTVDGATIRSADGETTLDADGDGQPGGVRRFAFRTVSLAAVPATRIVGRIVDPGPDLEPMTADDFDPGPDGIPHTADDVYLLPIAGVDVYLLGMESRAVTTGADGRFVLDGVPGGNVKVVTDGRTATAAPAGFYFPEMVMDATMRPGVDNFVMAGMETMYLPRLRLEILEMVDASATTMLELKPEGSFGLTDEERQRLTIEVQPGSLVGPDGENLAAAEIGVSVVPAELVRDMLPPGILQHTFDITVQALGVSNFSTPAPMTFPNVSGAEPGTTLDFLSFDHTTGRLVIEGTATVSEDGLTVVTDPDTGITHPGWHGLSPPGSETGPDEDSPANDDEDDDDDGPKGPAPVDVFGISTLFTRSGSNGTISIRAGGTPKKNNPASVTVTMQGVRSFLDGFSSDTYSFKLKPGFSNTFALNVKKKIKTDRQKKILGDGDRLERQGLDGEILTGSIQIVATSTDKDGNIVTVASETFYYGRLITQLDAGLQFPETLETEQGGEGGAAAVINDDGTVDLKLRERGPVDLTYRLGEFDTDERISFEQSGDDLTITLTPDPDNKERPKASMDVVAPDQEDMGGFSINSEPPLSLDPLAVRIVQGEIKKFQDREDGRLKKGFRVQGRVEIGLAGGEFVPLAAVQGELIVFDDVIKFRGGVSTPRGQFGEFGDRPIFAGAFVIQRGKAKTETLEDKEDKPDEAIRIAGLEITLKSLEFADGQLKIQGKVKLPKALGEVTLAFEKDDKGKGHEIIIDRNGISVTGGKIGFPKKTFKLLNVLEITASGLEVEYARSRPAPEPGKPSTPAQLLIRGSFIVKTKLFEIEVTLKADKEKMIDDGFIRVQTTEDRNNRFEIDVVGRADLKDDVRLGPFQLKDAFLKIDTTVKVDGQDSVLIGGGGKLIFPSWPRNPIEAELEFLGGELNKLIVGVDGLNIPIAMSGFFLQRIAGGLEDIVSDKPLTAVVSVGVTGGSEIVIPAPQFLGGTIQGSLIRIDGTIKINKEMLSGEVVAKVLGGLANGKVMYVFNWAKGEIFYLGSLGVFDNTFSVTGKARANTNLDIYASLIAKGKIPEAIPIVGGINLPSAGAVINLTNNANTSDDFIAVFGKISTFVGNFQAGLKLSLDGSFDVLGGSEIDNLVSDDTMVMPIGRGADAGPNAVIGRFDVPVGRPWVMLAARWENDAPDTEVVVVTPDGVELTRADVEANPNMAIEAELSNSRRTVISILDPAPGEWTVFIDEPAGLGEVDFHALGGDRAPVVSIVSPATDTSDELVTIEYEATDPDSDASVTLFFDSDRAGFDGLPIAADLPETDGRGQFVWDTSGVPSGEYFVYARIDDGANGPQFSPYSLGSVRVRRAGAPPPVEGLTARWIGDNQVELVWDEAPRADFYLISATGDAAGVGFEQEIPTSGPETRIVLNDLNLLTPLVRGETYRFEVVGVDDLEDGDFLLGERGTPAVTVVGPAPTVAPGPGELEVFADPGTVYTAQIDVDVAAGETLELVEAPAGATLDVATGAFELAVPANADGFLDIVINRTDANGAVEQLRFVLLADADRTGGIAGQKFADVDRDGVRGTTEAGVDGVTIELVDAISGVVLAGTTTASIDVDGSGDIDPITESGLFAFGDLTPGTYRVREVIDETRPELFGAAPVAITARVAGGAVAEVSIGAPAAGAIRGRTLLDSDFDGTGDIGLAGVEVFLDINANGEFDEGLDSRIVSSEDDPETAGVDETGQYAFQGLAAGTYLLRAVPPEDFGAVAGITRALAADEELADVDFALSFDPGDPATDSPDLLLADAVDVAALQADLDLGTVLVDGAGGEASSLDALLINIGGRNLVIGSVTVDDPTGSFSITPIAPGTTILPEDFLASSSAVAVTIRFDPTVTGRIDATLDIESNDPGGTLNVNLFGNGLSPDGELVLDVPNNNAGGIVVGDTALVAGFATLTNSGASDLTITDIQGDDAFGPAGLPAGFGPSQPIVLAPGESVAFDLTATPGRIGLERGALVISSDDPASPRRSLPVVATGLPAIGDALAYGEDFVAVFTPTLEDSPIFRTVTDDSGTYSFFLPAETTIQVITFDPKSGLVAHFTGTTEVSGTDTVVNPTFFRPSIEPDSDGDGLPDDVEFAIGSNADRTDTDGDGIDDFSEIAQGLDPLGGLGLPIGVVGAVELSGDATAVVVAGSLDDAEALIAYVATGSHGLGLVDVTLVTLPVVLGEIELPGTAVDVALDVADGLAAVAAGVDGLHIVDVRDPMALALLETVPLAGGAARVEVLDGAAYVTSGSSVVSVDLITREVQESLDLGAGTLTDIAIDGSRLFTMDADSVLTVIDVTADGLRRRGSAQLSDGGGHLFVGNDVALATVRSFFRGGFATVDVSNADAPLEISGTDASELETLPATDIAANGSGLAVLVGVPFATAFNQARVFDVSDPDNTNAPLTGAFTLPAAPLDVGIAAGFAFIADGSAGLQVLNYLQLDTGGVPPSVTISTPVADEDPQTEGIQVVEGTTIPIDLRVTDDVQVRRVELLVNGRLVANEVSFPYSLATPAFGDSMRIRVRAVDTGGNAAFSNTITIQTSPDLTPPAIERTNIDAGVVGANFRAIRVRFSEAMARGTIVPANFTLRRVGGPVIAPLALRLRNDDTVVQINYPTLARADHVFEINAPLVTDRAGNPLGAAPILLGFTGAEAAGPLFPGEKFDVGGPVNDVVTVDVNGDGRLDVVAAVADFSANPGHVAVLLGSGDGTLGRRAIFATGERPVAVIVADIDLDGRVDLVTANESSADVSVLRGRGDGTFLAPVHYDAGNGLTDVLAIDVDLDGDPDLVTGSSLSRTISVLANRGDGTFEAAMPLGAVISPATVVADLDGDGLPDLATPRPNTDDVSVVTGQPGGTFGEARTFVAGDGPYSIVATDVDGDLVLDLLVANANSDDVSVLIGRGDATFETPERRRIASGDEMVLVDLDGDGDLDFASASRSKGVVSIQLDDGTGLLGPPSSITTGVGPTAIEVDDINGDGTPDLVVANNSSGDVAVVLGLGDGTFGSPDVFESAARTSSVIADIDGDGVLDVASTSANTDSVFILFGVGSGAVSQSVEISVGDGPGRITTGDLDGDGSLELIVANDFSDDLTIVDRNAAGVLTAAATIPIGDGARDVVTADVDADGALDILVALNSFSVDGILVLPGNGDGTFQEGTLVATSSPNAIEVADVDRSGTLDLVVAGDQFFAELSVLPGNGDGTFGASTTFRTSNPATDIVLADLDGDGNLDAVLSSSSRSNVSVLPGTATGEFLAATVFPTGSNPIAVTAADLDGDGAIDIITADRQSSFGGTISVLRGNGDGTLSAPVGYNPAIAPSAIIAIDADGDGDLDLFAGPALIRGAGDGTFAAPISLPTGNGPSDVLVRDLDKDGQLDIATSNSSSRTITIHRGLGGAAFAPPSQVFSNNVQFLAAGDLDNDGNLDVVVTKTTRQVSVFPGNGDGTLGAESVFDAGEFPRGIDAVDLDGDGNIDVVMTSDRVVLALDGNGDGTLGAPRVIAEGFVSPARFVDLDGDTIVDLVTADTGRFGVQVAIGRGDGTFEESVLLRSGLQALRAEVADLDRDGFLDIAHLDTFQDQASIIRGRGGASFEIAGSVVTTIDVLDREPLLVEDIDRNGSVDLLVGGAAVIFGNGDGTFQTALSTFLGDVNAATTADVDLDGTVDLVTVDTQTSMVSVLFGRGDGTFAGRTRLQVDSNPESVLVADVNGDGFPDILTTNTGFSSDSVSIFPGNGDGTFGARADVPAGNDPTSAVTADVNGDTVIDIVTVERGSRSVMVLLGTGGGSFGAPTAFEIGEFGSDIEAEDLDGDGDLDLAVATPNSSDLRVLLNNGDGTFGTAIRYGSTDEEDVALADVDGDGNLDSLTVDLHTDQVSIHLGAGDGSFGAATTISVGDEPQGIAIADVNGDTNLDIITPNARANTISVLLGNGDGTFGAATGFATGRRPEAVVLADVDGDLDLDAVTANKNDDNVSVLLGNGDGTFGAPQAFASGNGTATLAVGDVDGDGILDIVSANEFADTVSVLIGVGDGTFGPATALSIGDNPEAVLLLDLDGDLDLDIATSNSRTGSGGNAVAVRLGNGDGTFGDLVTFDAGRAPRSLSPMDADGDGIIDLAVRNEGFAVDGVSVLIGAGDGTFDPLRRFDAAIQPRGLTAGDVNNDGVEDLVTDSATLLGNGDGSFRAVIELSTGGRSNAVEIADVDGNGVPDLVATRPLTNENSLAVFTGLGNGVFAEPTQFPTGAQATALAFADVNGDGNIDAVTANDDFTNNDTVSVLLGVGDGTFGAPVLAGVGRSPISVSLADVDGDGATDVVVPNRDRDVAVLLGRGDGTLVAPVPFENIDGADLLADLDGDGTLDAATLGSRNTVDVRFGNGDGTFGSLVTVAVLGSRPVHLIAADVNGDTISDLVSVVDGFGSADVGVVVVMQSNGDRTFAAPVSFTAGFDSTFVAASDLDSDGALDLAVANGGSNDISVLAGNGDGTFADAVSFRATLRPGGISLVDIDGDGALDAVVSSTTTGPSGEDFSAVLRGKGDGTFATPRSLIIGDVIPRAIISADFDGDSRLDLGVGVSGRFGSGGVAVLLGLDGGVFGPPSTFAQAAGGANDLRAADVNDDGFLDLVTSTFQDRIGVTFGNGDGTFGTPATLAPGGSPNSVDLGDLDRDGLLDIVVTNSGNFRGPGNVAVLRGTSTSGTFAAPVTFLAGRNPQALSVADINADGELDAITGNADSFDVSVLLGLDGASFAAPVFSAAGTSPVALAMADVNGDGVVDAIVPNNGFPRDVTLLLGNGDGTWSDPISIGGGIDSNPVAAAIGDVDNDADADVVVASQGRFGGSGPSVAVFIGDGTGIFAAPRLVDLDTNPTALALIDANSDGSLDVVVTRQGAGVTVLINEGDGTFAGASRFTSADGSNSASGDLNGDGNVDVVTTSRFGSTISIVLGNGDGTFGDPTTVETGNRPEIVRMGDLDGDGDADVVVIHTVGDDIAVFLGNPDGTLGLSQRIPIATDMSTLELADADGDAVLDILSAKPNGNVVVVMRGLGDGTFDAPRLLATGSFSFVLSADLDGDGFLDLVAAEEFSNRLSVSRGSADGSFGPPAFFSTGFRPVFLELADLDADGNLDAVTANLSGGNVSVLFGNGDATFGAAVNLSAGSGPRALAVVDVNGDSNPDVVVANNSSDSVSVIPGNGDRTFGAASTFSAGDGPTDLVVEDFDGDGNLDVATANFNRSNVAVLLGDGVGAFGAPSLFVTGSRPDSIDAADLDGDGDLDLATIDQGFNVDSRAVSVLAGNGDGTFADAVSTQIPILPEFGRFGDLDGDGNVELVIVSRFDGTAVVLGGNGAGGFDAPVFHVIGGQPASVAFLDFDGDAATDVLLGAVVVLGAGDGTLRAGLVVTSGETPQSVFAGDVDGDGRVDLVTVSSTRRVAVNLGQLDGFSAPIVGDDPIAERFTALGLVDLNGDRYDDLIGVGGTFSDPGRVLLLRSGGDGTFAPPVDIGNGTSPDRFDAADIDGDGHIDLVLGGGGNTIDVLLGDSDGSFTLGARYIANSGPVAGITLVDVDGDGTLDILTRNAMISGRGDGTFRGEITVFVDGPGDVAIGDVDGDGVVDLAVRNRFGGVTVTLGTGGGGFGNNFDVGNNTSIETVQLGDLDGDGFLDLVTSSRSGTGTITVRLGNGDGTFGEAIEHASVEFARHIVIADVTGDGILDVVALSDVDSNPHVAVFAGTGDGSLDPPTVYAVAPDGRALGVRDIDSDGFLDIVIVHAERNQISVLFHLGQRFGG